MCKIFYQIIEALGYFGLNLKQRNNIAKVIYIQPLEACHLQMILAKGLSHFMRLRSSENFIQRGWLDV